jgi:hypothetical protein
MVPNTMNHFQRSQEKTGDDSTERARAQWMSEMRTKEGGSGTLERRQMSSIT